MDSHESSGLIHERSQSPAGPAPRLEANTGRDARLPTPISIERQLLERAYAAFNARDIDAALAAMDANVVWPNGMEGDYVYGRSAVREYWLRQWRLIDPRVEPIAFAVDATGRVIVEVHQVVRDLDGVVVNDQMVQHAYAIEDGRIKRMEILVSQGEL